MWRRAFAALSLLGGPKPPRGNVRLRVVAADGEAAAESKADAVDDMRVTLKENIALGEVIRLEAGSGAVVDMYLHKQDGRGVNAVAVEVAGGENIAIIDLITNIENPNNTISATNLCVAA